MELMSCQSSTEDVDVQAHDVFTCSVCVDRQMELGQADYATYRWVEVADDYFFAVHGTAISVSKAVMRCRTSCSVTAVAAAKCFTPAAPIIAAVGR